MIAPPSPAALGALALLAALAPAAARAADPGLRAELEQVARRTVLFGHQSVGDNILDGLRELSAEAGVPLRLAEVQRAGGLAPGTFAHVRVAENGDPLRKLASFEAALGDGPAPVDVALLKFCYVDVLEGTDAAALFGRYQAALAALEARHPRTTFVHVTAPVTAVRTGPKAFVKRLLGRDRSPQDNARREAYNALVRAAYAGREPLFDLARLEATGPDGAARTWAVDGRPVPQLAAEYTGDGGHLGPLGRRAAARELVRLLASLPAAGAAPPGDAR